MALEVEKWNIFPGQYLSSLMALCDRNLSHVYDTCINISAQSSASAARWNIFRVFARLRGTCLNWQFVCCMSAGTSASKRTIIESHRLYFRLSLLCYFSLYVTEVLAPPHVMSFYHHGDRQILIETAVILSLQQLFSLLHGSFKKIRNFGGITSGISKVNFKNIHFSELGNVSLIIKLNQVRVV